MSRGPNARTRVVFDGHDLTDRFDVVNVQRPFPQVAVKTVDTGADGAIVTGKTYKPTTLSMRMVCTEHERIRRREAMRDLMSWLDVDEPKRLSFSDDLGMWYEALPTGARKRTGYFNAEAVELSFLVPSPALWGGTRAATVPSGGSTTVRVGGTYRTYPVVVAETAVGDSSGLWGLSVDGSEHLHIPVAQESAQAVTADYEARDATVGGSPVLPTLDSDWWELAPGIHTIAMDRGTGAARIEWVERWL